MFVVWSFEKDMFYRNIGGIPYTSPKEIISKFWTSNINEVRPFKSILGARRAIGSYMWDERYREHGFSIHPRWGDEEFDDLFQIYTVHIKLGDAVNGG